MAVGDRLDFDALSQRIHPAERRPNLTVRTEAFVTRIVLEGIRAIGVAYTRGGEHNVVRADAEVVLSGGAINSPQLLMLSGIGPGAHLRDMGIDVVVESSGVGKKLQDHPVSGVLSYTKDTTDVAEMLGVGNLINILSPERVVIGGGVAQLGDWIFAPLRAEVRARCHSTLRDQVKIVPAALGGDAGAIGAAMWAYQRMKDEG